MTETELLEKILLTLRIIMAWVSLMGGAVLGYAIVKIGKLTEGEEQ